MTKPDKDNLRAIEEWTGHRSAFRAAVFEGVAAILIALAVLATIMLALAIFG